MIRTLDEHIYRQVIFTITWTSVDISLRYSATTMMSWTQNHLCQYDDLVDVTLRAELSLDAVLLTVLNKWLDMRAYESSDELKEHEWNKQDDTRYRFVSR